MLQKSSMAILLLEFHIFVIRLRIPGGRLEFILLFVLNARDKLELTVEMPGSQYGIAPGVDRVLLRDLPEPTAL